MIQTKASYHLVYSYVANKKSTSPGNVITGKQYFTIDFKGLHCRDHGLVDGCSFSSARQELFLLENFLLFHREAL